jgi:hypothetical protein
MKKQKTFGQKFAKLLFGMDLVGKIPQTLFGAKSAEKQKTEASEHIRNFRSKFLKRRIENESR